MRMSGELIGMLLCAVLWLAGIEIWARWKR